MTKAERFLYEQEALIVQFRKEFDDFIKSMEGYKPKRRKATIFNYWKEAIKICEDSGQQSNWSGLTLFFETLEIPIENQITEQQYESIING